MKKLRTILICLTLSLALGFTACNNTPAVTEITPQSVTMSSASAVLIEGGEAMTLTATVKYSDNTTDNKVTWKTSDASIVSVSEGVITAKGLGNATITASATDKDTVYATCAVEVIAKAEISLNATEAALVIGKGTLKLTATVKHKNGTIDSVASFVSSKPEFVTVDNTGLLTPKSAGIAEISATATDGADSLVSKCVVKVVTDTTSFTDGVDKGMQFTFNNSATNEALGYKIRAVDKTALTALVIPDSFKGARVVEIEAEGFRQCANVTSFRMGSSINKIGAKAFMLETETEIDPNDSESLIHHNRKAEVSSKIRANITLSAGIELAEWALADSPFKIVTIPEGVTEIPAYAFQGATITKVNLPTSLTSIKGYAFAGCLSLKEVSLAQTSLVTIGDAGSDRLSVGNSFAQCGTLTFVGSLPATLKTIEHYTFAGCSNLQDITLNTSLVRIGAQAFKHCAKIPAISIPASTTKVGEDAFGRWGADQTITVAFKSTEKPASWHANWPGDGCKAVISYKA